MSSRKPGVLPDPLTAASFRDGEWVNEVKLYFRLWRLLNRTRVATVALQQVWKAHQTTAVTLPNSAWTRVPMAATDVDPLGLGLSANGGLTIPFRGIYLVAGTGAFAGSTVGNRRLVQAVLNGGGVDIRSDEYPSAAGTCMALPASILPADAGQELTLQQWQDSGGNLTTGSLGTGLRGSLTVWRLA